MAITLSNIQGKDDARARIRQGTKIYAATDGDATQVWADATGATRINVAAGSYLGRAKSLSGSLQFVVLDYAEFRMVPVTAVAIESTGEQPTAAGEVEALQLVLQRDRITAHRLIAINAAAAQRKLTGSQLTQYQSIASRLETRKSEIVKAGWLSQARTGFDNAWNATLRLFGIGALPLVVVVPLGIVAVIATVGLAIWLTRREPESVADLTASLDLYNQVRAALPVERQEQFDQLIVATAKAAKEQAAPSVVDQIGQLAIGGILLVALVFAAPKFLNK